MQWLDIYTLTSLSNSKIHQISHRWIVRSFTNRNLNWLLWTPSFSARLHKKGTVHMTNQVKQFLTEIDRDGFPPRRWKAICFHFTDGHCPTSTSDHTVHCPVPEAARFSHLCSLPREHTLPLGHRGRVMVVKQTQIRSVSALQTYCTLICILIVQCHKNHTVVVSKLIPTCEPVLLSFD